MKGHGIGLCIHIFLILCFDVTVEMDNRQNSSIIDTHNRAMFWVYATLFGGCLKYSRTTFFTEPKVSLP